MRALIGLVFVYLLLGCQSGSVPQAIPNVFQRSGPALSWYPHASTPTLYGATRSGGNPSCKKTRFFKIAGCGTVFAVTLLGSERIVYAFKGGSDGRRPNGGLIANANRTLFGTTAAGGGSTACKDGCGTVFALTPNGSSASERVLHAFGGGVNGSVPNGNLYADAHGALFGTTEGGGDKTCNCGSVFKLTPSGTGYITTTIYRFRGGTDGATPNGGLIANASGALIGTTFGGGNSSCKGGCGTVYKLTPVNSGYTESVAYRFEGGTKGAEPNRVIAGANGTLFGVTHAGGMFANCIDFTHHFNTTCGTVFQLTPAAMGYAIAILHTFYGHDRAGLPVGGLLRGANGALYGITIRNNAGACCWGTAFTLTPSGAGYTFSLIYAFENVGSSAASGDAPNAGLVADPMGTLYGTTKNGGNPKNFKPCFFLGGGCGVVYKLKPSTRRYVESNLYAFSPANDDGRAPDGDLLFENY